MSPAAAPDTAATLAMENSKSTAVFPASVERAASGAPIPRVIDEPAAEMFAPNRLNDRGAGASPPVNAFAFIPRIIERREGLEANVREFRPEGVDVLPRHVFGR